MVEQRAGGFPKGKETIQIIGQILSMLILTNLARFMALGHETESMARKL